MQNTQAILIEAGTSGNLHKGLKRYKNALRFYNSGKPGFLRQRRKKCAQILKKLCN
jgi:hypothetical protein